MADLKTNYVDDELATSMQGKRQYNIVDSQGNVVAENVHIEDVSRYTTVGDNFGADDINAITEQVNQNSQQLTANTKLFQFAYDETKQKYGYTIDGEFRPFSGGAIYLGEYSADTTIDVSALGATSADQFLAVAQSIDTGTQGFGNIPASGRSNRVIYTKEQMTLSNGILSLTLPIAKADSVAYNAFPKQTSVPCKVYYVGDIENAS